MTKKTVTTKNAVKEVAATKTVKGAAKSKIVKFEDLLDNARVQVKEAECEVERLNEMLNLAKSKVIEKTKELNRLRMIKNNAFSKFSFTWTVDKQEASNFNKSAWSEINRYNTAKYSFCIILKERTDLKKYKWEVEISGNEITPAERVYNGSTYTDHDYIKRTYKGEELTLKFNTESAAREAVEQWKTRLIADHELQISQEKELHELAKLMPRIAVGSVVEHAVFGRGKVLKNISTERWSVQFEGKSKFEEYLKEKGREPRVIEPRLIDEESLKLIEV